MLYLGTMDICHACGGTDVYDCGNPESPASPTGGRSQHAGGGGGLGDGNHIPTHSLSFKLFCGFCLGYTVLSVLPSLLLAVLFTSNGIRR